MPGCKTVCSSYDAFAWAQHDALVLTDTQGTSGVSQRFWTATLRRLWIVVALRFLWMGTLWRFWMDTSRSFSFLGCIRNVWCIIAIVQQKSGTGMEAISR